MNGYWNGERAQIKGLTYVVTQVENPPLHWQNSEVGTRRQGLEITFKDETWIIDNQHGDGFKKVTEGHGMWTSGHSSVNNPKAIKYIDDDEIIREINFAEMQKQLKRFDDWAETADPELFAKLKAMRENIKERQKSGNWIEPSPGKWVTVSGTNQKVFVPTKAQRN